MLEKAKKILGFTLIELLAVISIIGILSAVLTPSINQSIKKAKRAKIANNLRQIALAYINYTSDGEFSTISISGDDGHDWAKVLAKAGYLNSADAYIFAEDLAVSSYLNGKPMPKTVMNINADGTSSDNTSFDKCPLSVVLISGLDSNAQTSNSPIAYTRGLNLETGTWNADGVFGTDGGFIVYLDGHVQFYYNVKNALVKYSDGLATSNIKETLHPDAKILEPKTRQ